LVGLTRLSDGDAENSECLTSNKKLFKFEMNKKSDANFAKTKISLGLVFVPIISDGQVGLEFAFRSKVWDGINRGELKGSEASAIKCIVAASQL